MSPMLDSSSDDDVPLAQKKAALLGPTVEKHAPVPAQAAATATVISQVKPDPSPVKKPAPAPETKTVPPKATPKEPAKVKKEQGPLKKETIPAASNGKPTASQISSSPSKIRVKKEYGLPGQTRDTPDEADPLRKFYTSLLVQRPASDMARKWCVMHGLLSEAEAAAYVDEVAAKKLAARPPSRQAAGSASPAPKRAASGQAPKRKSMGSAKTAPGAKHKKEEEDVEWSDDGSEQEVLPSKQRRGGVPRPPKPPAGSDSDDDIILARRPTRPAPAPRKPKASTRDVAFQDGGLGEESPSDDDVPLLARKR
uniref:Uncharacterized protein n=1 Tax=Auxenochlorella protothecoides TaxID=3075 RepID=A0A1D2AGN4_AUXPR